MALGLGREGRAEGTRERAQGAAGPAPRSRGRVCTLSFASWEATGDAVRPGGFCGQQLPCCSAGCGVFGHRETRRETVTADWPWAGWWR